MNILIVYCCCINNVLFIRCDICFLLDSCEYANYNIREKDIIYTEGNEYNLSPNEKNVCNHTEFLDYDEIQKIKTLLQNNAFSDMVVDFPVSSDKTEIFKKFCKDILKTPRADNMTKQQLQLAVTTWKTNNTVDWVTCLEASSAVIKENFKVMKIDRQRYANLLVMAKNKDPVSFSPGLILIETERKVLKFCLYEGMQYYLIHYMY